MRKHKNKPAPQFRFCTPGGKTSRTSKTSRKLLELVNAAADPGPPTLQHNMWMYSQNIALLHLITETVRKYWLPYSLTLTPALIFFCYIMKLSNWTQKVSWGTFTPLILPTSMSKNSCFYTKWATMNLFAYLLSSHFHELNFQKWHVFLDYSSLGKKKFQKTQNYLTKPLCYLLNT